MAAKPTETLAFEPTTAAVAVPSTKQAAGFQPGETPPAQYFNWLFRTFSRLYNYVKDGQFTGNHSIDGNTSISGDIDGAQDLSIAGDAAIAGSTVVTGSVTAAGVTVPTGNAVSIAGTSTLSVGGLVTASGGVSVPLQTAYKHGGGSVTRTIRLADCVVTAGTVANLGGTGSALQGVSATSGSTLYIPVPHVPNGSKVSSVVVYLRSTAESAATSGDLHSSDAGSASSSLASTGVNFSSLGTAKIASPASITATSGITIWCGLSVSGLTVGMLAVTVNYTMI